jgi:hypothetical protein
VIDNKYNQDKAEQEFWEARARMVAPTKQVHTVDKSLQSKTESLVEQLCNIGSGMILAYLIMELVLIPTLGIGMSPLQNVGTTVVLTIVSVIRGYVWRRFFNRKLHKTWTKYVIDKTTIGTKRR